MKVIYEPKGAAREYSELASNIYIGCCYGCKYCYAPGIMKKTREEYRQRNFRENYYENLKSDLETMVKNNDERRILFSFVTDPYQSSDSGYTRDILALCKRYKRPFCVLTKGGEIAANDFDLYFDGCAFATTLVLYKPEDVAEWEPFAANPKSRIESLKKAKEAGIHTWVSLEPIIDPKQTMQLVEDCHEYVDHFQIGRLNHMKSPYIDEWFSWNKYLYDLIALIHGYGCYYYVKDSLSCYLHPLHDLKGAHNDTKRD